MGYKKTASILVISLFAILPFHAFIVTYLTYAISGESRHAYFSLAAWKEFIILLIAIFFVAYIIKRKIKLKPDILDFFILSFFCLGIINAFFISPGYTESLFGAKYDFEFLFLFLILRHFNFSKETIEKCLRTVIVSGTLVISIGIFLIFTLPSDFLTNFGYFSPGSTYSPSHAVSFCQYVGGTNQCRVQSTFSGANQFANYLLIILPLLLVLSKKILNKEENMFVRIKNIIFKKNIKNKIATYIKHIFQLELFLFIFALICFVYTFSRSAWIGFFIALCSAVYLRIKNKKMFWKFAGIFSGIAVGIIVFSAIINPDFIFKVIIRPSSTQGHFERTLDGIRYAAENPLGWGLGKAGGQSNWFALGYKGFPPENWYIQIFLELGWIGGIIFIFIIAYTLRELYINYNKKDGAQKNLFLSLFLTLIAISTSALFLHSWEDASTALTFWGLAGLLTKNRHKY